MLFIIASSTVFSTIFTITIITIIGMSMSMSIISIGVGVGVVHALLRLLVGAIVEYIVNNIGAVHDIAEL